MSQFATTEECEVYLIAGGNADGNGSCYFKVGISSNVNSRLKSLRTGCPFEIDVALTVSLPSRRDATDLERRIHQELSDLRTSGEWFRGDIIGASVTFDECTVKHWVQSRGKTFTWTKGWLEANGFRRERVLNLFLSNGWPL